MAVLPSDRIQRNVDAVGDGRQVGGPVVDHLARAEAAHEDAILEAGGGNDVRAARLRDLDGASTAQ